MRITVEKEAIDKLYFDLNETKSLCQDQAINNRISNIQKFIKESIYNDDRQIRNLIKRMVYTRMKGANFNPYSRDEAKELYMLYQKLKDSKYSIDDALKQLELIQKKYKSKADK